MGESSPKLGRVIDSPIAECPRRRSCDVRDCGCDKCRLADCGGPCVQQHIYGWQRPLQSTTLYALPPAIFLRSAASVRSRRRLCLPVRTGSMIEARSKHNPFRHFKVRKGISQAHSNCCHQIVGRLFVFRLNAVPIPSGSLPFVIFEQTDSGHCQSDPDMGHSTRQLPRLSRLSIVFKLNPDPLGNECVPSASGRNV
jgi:hypothetical protein